MPLIFNFRHLLFQPNFNILQLPCWIFGTVYRGNTGYFWSKAGILFKLFNSPGFLHPNHPRLAASSTKASGWHTHIHSQQEKAWHTLPWEPEKNIPPWGKTGNSTIFWGDMFFPLENYSNLLVWTKFFYPNSNRIPIFLGATQFFVFISEDLNMIRGSTTSNTWVLENSWKGRPLHRWSWWIWVETHS